MSTERNELISRIMFAFSSVDDAYALERLADWVEASYVRKPRVVTAAEELDALPTGSVVMGERIKSVWKKIEGPDRGDELTVWWQAGWEEDQDSQEIIARGPVTVLHVGAQP